MTDTDPYHGFGIEMAFQVENQLRIAGDDLNRGRFSRLLDGKAGGGVKLAQRLMWFVICERQPRGVVEMIAVQVDIVSRLDSAAARSSTRSAHVQHGKIWRYFIPDVVPRENLAHGRALGRVRQAARAASWETVCGV